jgi:hypothetical protein
MKKTVSIYILLIISVMIILMLSLTGCPEPEDKRALALGVDDEYSPYLHIPYKKIYYANAGMEYSTDNQTTWSQCPGSVFDISINKESRVWIRDIINPLKKLYLGEVKELSGRPDLLAWEKIYIGEGNWEDKPYGYPGQTKKVLFYFDNIGTQSGYHANHRIQFYLSTDRIITSSDTPLMEDIRYDYKCPVGEVFGGQEQFTVPEVPYGTYYIGCILDATNVISELNEDNNTTPPECTAEFYVQDSDANTNGAFKFVNSWGTGTDWQNKGGDGHYWVTYSVMKKQQMMIYYFYNDFTHEYKPTVVAVFRLTHPQRNRCKVVVGLGDPTSPYMQKELQIRDGDNKIYSGAKPFPANNIVMDISEFAPAINDYNVFLSVENRSPLYTCEIDFFSVELYYNYDDLPQQVFDIPTVPLPVNVGIQSTGAITSNTKGQVTVNLEDILPLTRSSGASASIIEETPSEEELLRDMEAGGVYRESVNYNAVFDGKYGTGYKPPSEADWRHMKKLRSVSPAPLTRGTQVNKTVDHSITQYFPPIGEQGIKGACACFVTGYYITTFNEAKERVEWDLTGTIWSDGEPTTNQDKIFSPDFLYHQINEGIDEGSSMLHAASLVIRLGCSSWQEMPYTVDDATTWPSEAAFREAARYRGRGVGNNYWNYAPCGYFIIYNDADINMLKALIAAGYCAGTSIHVEKEKTNSNGFYYYLDPLQDVISDDDIDKLVPLNHAQTIVGFKDGTAWEPANPDA